MSNEDLYGVLQVRRTASVNEIKRAFRKLARRYHPDINPGDTQAEDRFKRITEAYEILSNPLKRQFYDVNGFYTDGVLAQRGNDSRWAFSFRGFDFTSSNNSQFGEIFGDLFGRQPMRLDPERGQDLEYQISITFDDSIRGLKSNISISRKRACVSCDGSGRDPGSHEYACTACVGTGKTTRASGHLQFSVTCAECGGIGRILPECKDCQGEGRVSGTEVLEVDLSPGMTTGSRIRVPGKGDAGQLGGPPGDLFVVTNTVPHPFFTRMGDNIHCRIPITVSEAALGAKLEVPTIDGKAVLRVPPGTQTGRQFRLRGKGAPSLLDAGVRGDQYVEVRIVVPVIGDERSKEILRELAKLNPQDPRKELWK